MPPKVAFIFGMVTATAILSVVGLAVVLPLSLRASKGSVAGADATAPSAAQGKSGETASTADIAKVSTKDSPFIGEESAPVTLAYWSDYQCPFCQRFDQETLPTLVSEYVEKGKLKIVFKDFAFLGQDSETAALAGRAVWEAAPKSYFAWHEAMYAKQDAENGGWGNKEDILALTKTISGINADKVARLMEDKAGTYQKMIDADRAEGSEQGVNGTPGFVLGKQLIAGAVPTAQFTSAIEAELGK